MVKKGGGNPAFFVSCVGITWQQELLPLQQQQWRRPLNASCTVSKAGARQIILRAMEELP
jgi:hypothetical protein